jgi:hypothetical protein
MEATRTFRVQYSNYQILSFVALNPTPIKEYMDFKALKLKKNNL